MMKKVLAATAVVCVMCIAGSALAQTSANRHQRPMNQPQTQQHSMRPAPDFPPRVPNQRNMSRDCRPDFSRRHKAPLFTPDMPTEMREKAVELAKLKIDLEETMTARPLNKQKALEVHAKIQAVKSEIEAWRFMKKLERIEAMQKQHELNRNVPPARPGMPRSCGPHG